MRALFWASSEFQVSEIFAFASFTSFTCFFISCFISCRTSSFLTLCYWIIDLWNNRRLISLLGWDLGGIFPLSPIENWQTLIKDSLLNPWENLFDKRWYLRRRKKFWLLRGIPRSIFLLRELKSSAIFSIKQKKLW